MGVGLEPISRKKLTIERLAKAIQTALTDSMRQRATNVGSKIEAEDGIARAVAVLQDIKKVVLPKAAYKNVEKRQKE